jgi:hypothetical protein
MRCLLKLAVSVLSVPLCRWHPLQVQKFVAAEICSWRFVAPVTVTAVPRVGCHNPLYPRRTHRTCIATFIETRHTLQNDATVSLSEGPSGKHPRMYLRYSDPHFLDSIVNMHLQSRTCCNSTPLPARTTFRPSAVAVAVAPRSRQQHQYAATQRTSACADCLTGSLDEGTPKGEESMLAGVPCYIRCQKHTAMQRLLLLWMRKASVRSWLDI